MNALAGLVESAAVLPGGERHWHFQQPDDHSVEQGQHRSVPRPRRSEHREQDPALCPVQLARQPQYLDRCDSGDRDNAAAGEQEHSLHVHPHAEAKPLQRFSNRLPPARLRHAESILCQRSERCRNVTRHTGLRRRHAIQQSRPPERQRQQRSAVWGPVDQTGISSTRPSRHRTSWPGTAARTTCGLDSICGGWPLAGERPTIRAACSTSPAI